MRKIASAILSVFLIVCVLSVPAFADSAVIALSKKSVNVGTNVTVTITYKATYDIYGLDATLTYNPAVLKYVSGGTDTGKAVKIVKDLEGEKSVSASVVFKTIAAGSGSLSLNASCSGKNGDNIAEGTASAGTAVTVTTPQPSLNANLSSIRLSEGTLSPKFKSGTTSYTATVKNSVEKITVTANTQAGDSTVSGAGTFNLKEGDNKVALTVTAASGAKKVYTVTVKRMTAEETSAAENEEREKNPTLIVVDGKDYFLKTELKDIGEIEGFEVSSVERKGTKIEVLSDKTRKYQLYYAADAEGQNGTFFTADENGEFAALNYIKSGNRLYIIEPFEDLPSVDGRFVPGECEIGGKSVKCYKYDDVEASDFYIFNCYVNGKNDYYRFDALENTVQRQPLFLAKPTDSIETVENQPQGIIDRFNALTLQAKTVLALLLLAIIMVVVLTVLLIIRATKKGKDTPIQENLVFDDLLGNADGNFDEIDISDIPEEAEPENEPESITADESEFLDSGSDNF